jgi:hypothetical protein
MTGILRNPVILLIVRPASAWHNDKIPNYPAKTGCSPQPTGEDNAGILGTESHDAFIDPEIEASTASCICDDAGG